MVTFSPTSQGMGIGDVGIGARDTVFKRKFRWTLEISGDSCPFQVSPLFVKLAARPSITFEETQLDFLNDRTWIPGKATWEPITLTYLDSNSQDASELLTWITSVFDFTSPTSKKMSSSIGGYAGVVTLKMLDGCGAVMETWEIKDAWPQAINFGDLDYGVSDPAQIELTLRYSQVSYTVGSCGFPITPCGCVGCQ
jgi:hypothetical protein